MRHGGDSGMRVRPMASSALIPDVEPAEVGLDAGRLARLDKHFSRYVDDGRLPGWLMTVSRHGMLAHVSACGQRDVEAGLPVEADTIWRIYSMSKPVTSVAAMILYEEGAFELTDPVSTFIPSFADVRVFTGGSDIRQTTAPATEPVRIWHLLTPTSGLTYGFHRSRRVLRHLGRDPAAVPAGFRVELLRGDRRARPRRRGRVGLLARRVLRQPHLRAARH